MILVVDYRNLAKISSFSILSGTVACCWPTEPEEIAHRIVKRLFCLRLDYPEADIVLANDKGPYWRTAFLNNWYSEQGLEPVAYKGNREGMAWPFATSKASMDEIYDAVMRDMSYALDAVIIEDSGLEADDIWAMIAVTAQEPVVGFSTDSDWRQLCSETINVLDPSTGIIHKEPIDITPKLIAGDRGDNIMGCPKKLKKGGYKGFWGADGAKKLVAEHPTDWMADLDAAVLERNRMVIKLPCPTWPIEQCFEMLQGCARKETGKPGEDEIGVFQRYGLTAETRKHLQDKAAREEFIAKLRANLQQQNEKAKPTTTIVAPEEQGIKAPEPEIPPRVTEAATTIVAPTDQEPLLPAGQFTDLGAAYQWQGDDPQIVQDCIKANHRTDKRFVGMGLYETSCSACKYKYLVDSRR